MGSIEILKIPFISRLLHQFWILINISEALPPAPMVPPPKPSITDPYIEKPYLNRSEMVTKIIIHRSEHNEHKTNN